MNHSQPGSVRVATEGKAFPLREFEAFRSLQKGRSLDGICTLDGRACSLSVRRCEGRWTAWWTAMWPGAGWKGFPLGVLESATSAGSLQTNADFALFGRSLMIADG